MATLDNVNLFAVGGATDDTQDPLYPEYLELVKVFEDIRQGPTIPGGYPDTPSFASFKKDKENELARQTLATELEAGNIKKAYEEGFTQLPIGEQLLYYINPVTGVPIETYETGYFTKEGGLGIKTPREMLFDAINPSKNIFQKSFVKAEDPVSAGIAPLSAIGALGGVFELANIPKAGLMALRRFQQKTMDGGGGGIGGLPEPEPQPALDDAGYKSNVLEEAKTVEIDSGQALFDYLTSPKRQNPSNNKTGIALKKSEIDEIDFDAFKEEMNRVYPEGNFDKEDLLQYIDDNRVKLYRVRRAEENPDVQTRDMNPGEDVSFYLDEPLTNEIYDERLMNNYDAMFNTVEDQKVFFERNFGPEGIITKETYIKYLDKPESGTQQNARGVFVNKLDADYNNSFFELEEPEFVFIRPDGTIDEDMSLVQSGLNARQSMSYIEDALNEGFTVKPKVLDENFDVSDLVDRASQNKTELESREDLLDKAYRYIGEDDIFEIIGNPNDGYSVRLNGEFDYNYFDENMSFNEAELQVAQYIDTKSGFVGKIDDPQSPDDLKDLVPEGVIKENQSLPTQYGERYADFRLGMGGATDYEEYTIHIENPKTTTRYKLGGLDEPKHFGGGDELFHLRTTLRTDENGKKVLFVEEIQSDLHSTARSTQSDVTYELPPKERQKIIQQLEDMGLREDPYNKGNFIYRKNRDDIILEDSIKGSTLGYLSKYAKAGNNIENFTDASDFINTFGSVDGLEIADIAEKLAFAELPDFPYKKDWVDMAVKEAMKIGAEKGADRVAFTNAATQIKRNAKKLDYVQDKVIRKVPTREEILASDEYAAQLSYNIDTRYQDYVNNVRDVSNPNAGELPMSKEEFLLTANVQEELQDLTLERIMNAYGTGRFKYTLEDVGYRLDGDAILNPQKIELVGDDYDTQRINLRRLTNDDELLYEIPEKFREQVKKDLAAGKKEITLNIDELEGSGKKLLEIYKNEIPRGINKVLKDLKVKDVKPNISNILYSTENIDDVQLLSDFRVLLRQSDDKDAFIESIMREPYESTDMGVGEGLMLHKSIGIDLTDEMKRKIIQEGLSSMYMGGKVTKSKSMDRPIEGNRREM